MAKEFKSMSDSDPPLGEPTFQEAFEEFVKAANPHYAAIGLIAANWADFEGAIDDWSLILADIPEDMGACFTAQVSGSGRKIDALISVIKLRGCTLPSAKDLQSFADKVSRLAEKRNRVIHDSWILGSPDKPHRFEVTARKKLRREVIHVPTDDLRQLAGDIVTLKTALSVMGAKAISSLAQTPPDK